MTITLTDWLIHARPSLIRRWQAELVDDGMVAHGHAIVTPLKVSLDLELLFDGLIAASTGNIGQFDDALGRFVSTDTNEDLPDLLAIAFRMRRSAIQLLREQADAPSVLDLIDGLDGLMDRVAAAIAHSWELRTRDLISEREFIAESLESASAAADERALQLRALNDISQQLSASLDVERIVAIVVSSIQQLINAHQIALWQLAETTEAATGQALHVVHSNYAPARLMVSLDEREDPLVRAFTKRTICYRDHNVPVDTWQNPESEVLVLPMVASDQVLGVITIQQPHGQTSLRMQQDLASGIINQAAIAIQNARLYHQIRTLNVELEQRVSERTSQLTEEKQRLATINEISIEVNSVLDLDSLLHTSLELLARVTQAEFASIMLAEEEEGLLATRAVLSKEPRELNINRFVLGMGIAGWVAQSRRSTLVDNVAADARWVVLPGDSPKRREGSMIAAPLIVQSNVLGVLILTHPENNFFHEDHLRLVNACCSPIAAGINNANLYNWITTEAERRAELLDRQQKESSQIASILQSLSDAVIVSDLNGSVLLVNPAAARIFQREVEELVVWNLRDLLQRHLGRRYEEVNLEHLMNRPFDAEDNPRRFETVVRIGMRMVNLTLGPVLKESGELLGALLVARDITREVEADRLKVEFIGTMSHELRTPMTAIKGFTQLLSMGGLGPLTETQREFVGTIQQNTERMIAMINDVLDITKIESGSVDLEMRALHVAEALSGAIAELQGLINGRQHELSMSLAPALPLVRADANRLHQILLNLIANAAKYTPRGGKLRIEAREFGPHDLPRYAGEGIQPGRRYVLVNVIDSGVGIDPDDLPRVFDRFYRTENPLKIEAGGTGLGLSLVRPLVEIMGGRIWVDSAVGEGSTFSFVLPIAA